MFISMLFSVVHANSLRFEYLGLSVIFDLCMFADSRFWHRLRGCFLDFFSNTMTVK